MRNVSKKTKEYTIFLRFASACKYYSIEPRTIEHSENPDIKCRLNDGTEKWFELTEIIDPNYLSLRKARIDFENILREYFLNDKLFLLTFQNKTVAIYFSDSFKDRQKLRKNLHRLSEYLHELNVKGVKEICPKKVFNFIDSITITESDFGAKIRVPNVQSVGIPIKERLDDKFRKRYSRDCDLVLYYEKLTIFSNTYPYADIIDYLENKNEIPFNKVWIFSLENDLILFEYPED